MKIVTGCVSQDAAHISLNVAFLVLNGYKRILRHLPTRYKLGEILEIP